MDDHDQFEGFFKNKFRCKSWQGYKTQSNEYNSKVYINQEFYEENRMCARKFRCNKRNLAKSVGTCDKDRTEMKRSSIGLSANDLCYQTSIPNTLTYTYEGMGSRAYNCKYTNDGQKILVNTQCGTSFFNVKNNAKPELSKVVLCNNINWAITDSKLSTDNQFMIHSTLNQYVHMLDIKEEKYTKEYDFGDEENNETQYSFNKTKVFSLDLSGDNKKVIAGCNKKINGASVKHFDLERGVTLQSVVCHKDDINGIAFLNKDSSQTFITASDDGTSKLWDTRILKNNEPAGIFYGHVSGLTCAASKNDDRHFVTNSKDQSLKLWDVRKYSSQKKNHPYLKYDYRCEVLTPDHINEIKEYQKKLDNSLMTFWGHQVHLTLIRCDFSPLYTTGQRFIYTGSFDGRIYVYDTLTGNNCLTLELPKEDDNIFQCPVIRDCTWHPSSQTMVNTSFLGGIYKWEYSDLRDAEFIETDLAIEEEGEQDLDNQRIMNYNQGLPCNREKYGK